MRIRRILAGSTFVLAALAAPVWAAERPRVVQQAMTFESGGRAYDVEVYRPDDDARHPTVIYLHGGAFSFRDPLMARFHAELAGRGLVVLAPHYLLDRTGWQHWQKTAIDAVTFAGTLPHVDPERIGMSGLSMGGQVGLSAAARDARVKAVAEFFTAWPGSLPDEPIAHLPPVLLLNGTVDPIIPLSKAVVLDQILQEQGLPFERKIYRGVGHGFSGASFGDAVRRTALFFGGRDDPDPLPGPTSPDRPSAPGPTPLGSPDPILDPADDEGIIDFPVAAQAPSPLASRKKKRRPPLSVPLAPAATRATPPRK